MASSIGVGKDYTTITAWAADLGGAASDDGEVYDEVYDETFLIDAGTTPTLSPATGEGHDSTEGTGARIVWSTDRTDAQIDREGCVVEDLEFDGGGYALSLLLQQYRGMHVRRCIFHDAEDQYVSFVKLKGSTQDNTNPQTVSNCVFYDNLGWNYSPAITAAFTPTRTSWVFNNTILGLNSDAQEQGIRSADSTIRALKNNIVVDCLDYDFGLHGASTVTATNASSDSTAPSAIDGEPVVSSTEFTSTSSPPDLSLASGAECADLVTNPGTDLGTTYNENIDITGRDRDSEGDTWSLGAFQYVAAASTGSKTGLTLSATPGRPYADFIAKAAAITDLLVVVSDSASAQVETPAAATSIQADNEITVSDSASAQVETPAAATSIQADNEITVSDSASAQVETPAAATSIQADNEITVSDSASAQVETPAAATSIQADNEITVSDSASAQVETPAAATSVGSDTEVTVSDSASAQVETPAAATSIQADNEITVSDSASAQVETPAAATSIQADNEITVSDSASAQVETPAAATSIQADNEITVSDSASAQVETPAAATTIRINVIASVLDWASAQIETPSASTTLLEMLTYVFDLVLGEYELDTDITLGEYELDIDVELEL